MIYFILLLIQVRSIWLHPVPSTLNNSWLEQKTVLVYSNNFQYNEEKKWRSSCFKFRNVCQV